MQMPSSQLTRSAASALVNSWGDGDLLTVSCHEKARGVITPSGGTAPLQELSRLCDRVLHRSEAFRVSDGDIDRLQRSDASRALGVVGIVRELDALVGLSPHSNALGQRWR